MKLYYAPGACSLSPHIALREAGIPFDLVKVDTRSHQYDGGGDFYSVNGKGYVPVLELDGGERLTEGPAIVQYIADRKPDAGLAPKPGTLERVRLQEWLNFLTSEVHKTFSPLFSAETPEDYKPVARKKLAGRFDWLSKQLDGRQHLLGERFTVADGYLFVLLGWTNHVGMKLEDWPVLKSWREHIAKRPAVQAALKAEGLIQ
ncbi:MAG TPA: glutathione transferase GstA [Usitatibacter sp.]|nr:glutathione transferase GstA [Usitatibacter sp.]